MTKEIKNKESLDEVGDPSVPTELLELHIELEERGATPEEFKEYVES